jgi:hypothetical protein
VPGKSYFFFPILAINEVAENCEYPAILKSRSDKLMGLTILSEVGLVPETRGFCCDCHLVPCRGPEIRKGQYVALWFRRG